MAKSNDFNAFRFGDIKTQKIDGGKMILLNRVNSDESIVVIDVPMASVVKTKFGFMLVLDEKNVVYLKKWQVNRNKQHVVIHKDYYTIKELQTPFNIPGCEIPHQFTELVAIAKTCNPLVWEEQPFENDK